MTEFDDGKDDIPYIYILWIIIYPNVWNQQPVYIKLDENSISKWFQMQDLSTKPLILYLKQAVDSMDVCIYVCTSDLPKNLWCSIAVSNFQSAVEGLADGTWPLFFLLSLSLLSLLLLLLCVYVHIYDICVCYIYIIYIYIYYINTQYDSHHFQFHSPQCLFQALEQVIAPFFWRRETRLRIPQSIGALPDGQRCGCRPPHGGVDFEAPSAGELQTSINYISMGISGS